MIRYYTNMTLEGYTSAEQLGHVLPFTVWELLNWPERQEIITRSALSLGIQFSSLCNTEHLRLMNFVIFCQHFCGQTL